MFEPKRFRGKTVVPCIRYFQMLYDYLHSHLQPWFKADVQAILDEPEINTLRAEKYVSLHIRRTDKRLEVKHTKTKVDANAGAHLQVSMRRTFRPNSAPRNRHTALRFAPRKQLVLV